MRKDLSLKEKKLRDANRMVNIWNNCCWGMEEGADQQQVKGLMEKRGLEHQFKVGIFLNSVVETRRYKVIKIGKQRRVQITHLGM